MMNNTMILLTPKAYLSQFACAADRAYFSHPITVNIVRKDEQGLVWVTDPNRGHTYPVNPHNLKHSYQLTNRQKAALN